MLYIHCGGLGFPYHEKMFRKLRPITFYTRKTNTIMKKALLPFLILSGLCSAANVDVTLNANTTYNLSDIVNAQAAGNTIRNIYVQDNVTLNVDRDLSISMLTFVTNSPISTLTLNFTWNKVLTLTDKMWLDDNATEPNPTLNIGLVVNDDQLDAFKTSVSATGTYTQTLIQTNKTWEVAQAFTNNKVSLTLSDNLETLGYSVKTGNVTNTNALTFGEIGVGQSTWAQPIKLQIKAVPEPASAMLSLLGLAGVAVRRRRK